MKGCEDYSPTIQLYVDQELSGEELQDFLVHLEECPSCRTELEAEESLSALLHRSRPLYRAPDTLRQQVLQAVESAPASTPYAPVRLRKHVTAVLARPLRAASRRAHVRLALVAAMILLAAGLLLMPGMLEQANATSYIDAAIEAHRGCLNGNLPLEVQSGSPAVVAAWFTGKVPFNFRLPTSPDGSGQGQVYRLTGGRLVNYKGAYAALVAYQMQQQRISLLVASSSSAVAAGGEVVPSGKIDFHYSKHEGFNVITWSNHGLTYALVSSLPGSGRQSCMVCHQNMADGAHFSAHRDETQLGHSYPLRHFSTATLDRHLPHKG
jgi:mycothiol system anti-sigma-R factor